MNKNEYVEITIDSYGEKGEGVGRADGLAVFVPFAIVGERVKAKIILSKKSYAVGKLVEVLESSPERVLPICPYFSKCGGCQLMHMSDSEKANFKKQKVSDAMQRIAKLDVTVDNVVSGQKSLRYRNKLQMPLGCGENGLIGGFYAPFSHRIIPVEDCVIQNEESIAVFKKLKEFANEYGVSGYDESSQKGLLRHLVMRTGENGMLVTVVINGKRLPYAEKLAEKLKEIGRPFGLYVNENTEKTNVVFGKRFTHICGIKELGFSDNGIKYSVLPQSFLQVNDEIKDVLYSDAVEKAGIDGETVVINAYSGAGLLTALFSLLAKRAIGIEIVPEASKNADKLKAENGIANMENVCGDCAEELPKVISALRGEKSVLVLDPPRKGVDEKVIASINSARPEKIVYISCNPATLARDLKLLSGEYDVLSVTPYDMFPNTSHVETMAFLGLKSCVEKM